MTSTSNKSKPSVSSSSDSVIGYIHQLSGLKTSQSTNNTYFDFSLQTEDKRFRAVCFSAEKHKEFKAKSESSSAVKLTKFNLKRNTWTQEDELHITKRTKLEDPNEKEMNFDFQVEDLSDERSFLMTSIKDLLETECPGKVSIMGRVTFTQELETIMTKGKTLTKQEAVITDHSSSMRLVLWEDDITKVISGSCYRLIRVAVKSYQEEKYITLNKQSHVVPSDEIITRNDDIDEDKYAEVQCPPEAIKSLQCFHSCNKCRKKVIPLANKKITKCSECGLVQLSSKCTSRMFVNAIFNFLEKEISLVIFDDKLEELYKLYCEQQDCTKPFAECNEDEIMTMLLTVFATVVYNKNNNSVLSIKRA